MVRNRAMGRAIGRNRFIAPPRRQAAANGSARRWQEWRNKAIAPYRRAWRGRDALWTSQHSPGQLVLDVKPDDVIEVALDELESKRPGPCRVEVARPSLHNAGDDWIGRVPDPRCNAIAGDAAQRGDLLGDRDRQPRHREIAAAADAAGVDCCGVDQEADRRARRGVPVAYVLADRQQRPLTIERLADDAGEEA